MNTRHVIVPLAIVPLALALAVFHAGHAGAQDASPPPKPFPSEGAAPVPGGGLGMPAASDPSQACMNDYALLREEAEKRGRLIKVASERNAPPDEACKLIVNFGESQRKMIRYVEANAAKCAIQPQVADQLRAAQKNTDALWQKVCLLAKQMQGQSPRGPAQINDIGDPATEELFRISPPSQKPGPTRLE